MSTVNDAPSARERNYDQHGTRERKPFRQRKAKEYRIRDSEHSDNMQDEQINARGK
jgi:hypothetical protein